LIGQAALALGQPFQGTTYDFSRSDVTSVVSKQSEIMLKERLTSPPLEAYTIHRKFAGNFVTSVKLGLKDAPIRHHFYRASGLKEPPLPL
jgi:aarF domain-containing kinase